MTLFFYFILFFFTFLLTTDLLFSQLIDMFSEMNSVKNPILLDFFSGILMSYVFHIG